MRDRLVVAFVSLTLLVVAVFLVERAYTTSALIHADEQRKVERSALILGRLLGDARVEVTPALLESVIFTDEHVVYETADGERVEAARHTSPGTDDSHDADDLTATSEVSGGGSVTVTRHVELVDARVASAIVPLVLVALGLVLLAVLAALWLAHRLSRPFAALAAAARRIGSGDFTTQVPRSRIPEADEVARALRTSAEDLQILVQRERDFAAHASHQLRTPITATRLELEDLALSEDTSPEVATRVSAALGQLDRLSTTVAGILDASRQSRLGAQVPIDLGALVRDTTARWQDLAPARTIALDAADVVPLRAPTGALMQVVDILIGNAVTHGVGRVAVTVTETPAYVEVRVADEGPRQRTADGMRSPVAAGVGGLATAMEIAEALGGRLRLTDEATTTFSLALPRVDRETVAS